MNRQIGLQVDNSDVTKNNPHLLCGLFQVRAFELLRSTLTVQASRVKSTKCRASLVPCNPRFCADLSLFLVCIQVYSQQKGSRSPTKSIECVQLTPAQERKMNQQHNGPTSDNADSQKNSACVNGTFSRSWLLDVGTIRNCGISSHRKFCSLSTRSLERENTEYSVHKKKPHLAPTV